MKKPVFSKIIRLAAAGLALLLPALVWADTARLAGDTFINPGDGTNYGNLPNVNVGGATSSSGLLVFDLSTLSATSGVAWARLRVYVDKVTPAAHSILAPRTHPGEKLPSMATAGSQSVPPSPQPLSPHLDM